MTWPTSQGEYEALAKVLSQLVGGRRDCAARFYDFTDKHTGNRVMGWSPWKERKVEQGYQPADGELVLQFKAKEGRGFEDHLMRPLSVANLVLHLRGKERLGVYALDKAQSCSFIAADFDDHEGTLKPEQVWAQVRKFSETCDANEFTVHVERSKGGRGYHVWMFFDSPVPAGEARALGRWLFNESEALRDDEDFNTFDRFFPAQSVASGRELGNLIGLPLAGKANYVKGLNAWVDDNGETIPDAVAYTNLILNKGRNAATKVGDFLREWKIEPDQTATHRGPVRDPDRPVGTTPEFQAVLSRCKFLQWASTPEHAATLPEPLWYGAISNAARFAVDDWIHEASSHYPRYSSAETDSKIHNARCSSGPRTCSTIQSDGFQGCPRGGCKLPTGKAVAAPAGLSIWHEWRGPIARPGRDGGVHVDANPAPQADEDEERTPWPSDLPRHPETGAPWPPIHGSFFLDGGGINMNNSRGSELIATRPIWVEALTEGIASGEDGIVIKFFNRRWRLKQYAVPVEMLHEQGGVLAKVLHSQGAIILPGKEKWVSRYLVIQESAQTRFIQATSRLGWMRAHSGKMVFVLPDRVVGAPDNEIVYQSDIPLSYAESMRPSGSLESWRMNVAWPAKDNPLMMFALMIGLAGPLLKPCEEQGGGFHYYGTTTGGKTTCGQLAMSVWGNGADPSNDSESTAIRKWDATMNAMEGIAELHSHQVLVLDEIGQTEIQDVGQAIYKLAGGKGKERSTINGGLRKPRSWRTLIFSNGEVSLNQMAIKNKQALKGGQALRIVDVPVDNEDGERGIVIEHGDKDPKIFVEEVKEACAQHYGTAGPALVAWLLQQYEERTISVVTGDLRQQLKKMEGYLTKKLQASGGTIPPEGRRVVKRFALVAVAGVMAGPTCAGVLDWTAEQVAEATLHVARRWLASVGEERSEADRGLAQLRENIMARISSFVWANEKDAPQREIVGYRTDDYYLLTQQGFVALCGDYDFKMVANTLRERGLLWCEPGRLVRKAPIIKIITPARPRVYWIKNEFLGEIGAATEEDRRGVAFRESHWEARQARQAGLLP